MRTNINKIVSFFILFMLQTELIHAASSFPRFAREQRNQQLSRKIPGTPIINISASATVICKGTRVTFTAAITGATTIANAKGIWRKNNKVVGTQSINYTDASLVNKDIISFLLVTPLGSHNDTATSNYIVMEVASMVKTIKDTVKVDGDSAVLDAGPGYSSYKWNTGDHTQAITVRQYGNYAVTLTNWLGCSGSYTSYVSLVKARILITDTTVCKGSQVLVSLGRIKDLYDTLQVDQFVMSFNEVFDRAIKTSIGGSYFYTVSGSYSLWGGKCDKLDAFYDLRGPTAIGGFRWIGHYITTPSLHAYNPSHEYISSPFTTGTVPLDFGFSDIQYKDNCGSLNFTVYKICPRPLLSILWSTGETSASINTNPTTTTTYGVTVSDGITTSKDSITIRVTEPLVPSISISASSADTCAGKLISFTAQSKNGGINPNYQWSVNSKNVGTDDPVYSTSSLADGDVVACNLTSHASCVTTESVNSKNISVVIHPVIIPGVNVNASSTSVCQGSKIVFTASTVNEGSSIVYQWLVNNLASGTNSKTYSTNLLANHDVIRCMTSIKSNLQCLASKEALSEALPITIYPNPQISFSKIEEVVRGQQIQLYGSVSGNASLKWTPSIYLSNDTISNPVVTPIETTNYTLTAVTGFGCTSFAEVKVKVLGGLVIPNAFSPNGDGINDTWSIVGFGNFPSASVSIFNRYGQKVYQSIGYNKNWTGDLNGSPLPVATYYYVIALGDHLETVSGSVTLLR